MTVPMQRLRLDVGLAHATTGTVIALRTNSGQTILAGSGPGADLTTCGLRRSLVTSLCPTVGGTVFGVTEIEIGGALENCGGDHYRYRGSDGEHRVFATSLSPKSICDVIEALEADREEPAPLNVTIKPDPELHVTVIEVTSDSSDHDRAVVAAADHLYEVCLVDELISSEEPRRANQGRAAGEVA